MTASNNTPGDPALQTLLRDTRAYLQRYLFIGTHELNTLVLWAAHTWVFEEFYYTPYVHVKAATKGAGKSRTLDVVKLVAFNPWKITAATGAVVVRKMAQGKHTMFIDEVGTLFTDRGFKSEGQERLRSILDVGFEESGTVPVNLPSGKQGGGWKPTDFNVFCPKILAGIGQLPGTIRDRTIPVELRRRNPRNPKEAIEKFRRKKVEPHTKPLREQYEAWATRVRSQLADAEPKLPDGLSDRSEDIWEPLLVIAECAGPEEVARAHAAAMALSGEDAFEEEQKDFKVALLHHIHEIYAEDYRDRATDEASYIPSSTLVEHLNSKEEWPYQRWGNRRENGLSQHQLARYLGEFQLRPHPKHTVNGTRQCYVWREFHQWWERYPLETTNHKSANENGAVLQPQVPKTVETDYTPNSWHDPRDDELPM